MNTRVCNQATQVGLMDQSLQANKGWGTRSIENPLKSSLPMLPCWDDCWHPVKSIAVPEDWHLILTQYIGWWWHVEFVAHKVGKQQEQQQPAIPREVWLMKQSVASWFHSQSAAAWMQSFFFFFFLHQFQRVSEWSEFLRAENFRFRVPCEFWFQAAATTTTNSKCFWTRWISLEKYFRFSVPCEFWFEAAAATTTTNSKGF